MKKIILTENQLKKLMNEDVKKISLNMVINDLKNEFNCIGSHKGRNFKSIVTDKLFGYKTPANPFRKDPISPYERKNLYLYEFYTDSIIKGQQINASGYRYLKSIEEGKIDDYLDKKRADANTASAYSDKKKSSTKQPSVTINKGRAYGGSNQKDDEGDDKPETTEKRGRGRPTGSKSGARQKGNGYNDGGIPVHNLNLPTRNNKF
jgi:hypothetical protein